MRFCARHIGVIDAKTKVEQLNNGVALSGHWKRQRPKKKKKNYFTRIVKTDCLMHAGTVLLSSVCTYTHSVHRIWHRQFTSKNHINRSTNMHKIWRKLCFNLKWWNYQWMLTIRTIYFFAKLVSWVLCHVYYHLTKFKMAGILRSRQLSYFSYAQQSVFSGPIVVSTRSWQQFKCANAHTPLRMRTGIFAKVAIDDAGRSIATTSTQAVFDVHSNVVYARGAHWTDGNSDSSVDYGYHRQIDLIRSSRLQRLCILAVNLDITSFIWRSGPPTLLRPSHVSKANASTSIINYLRMKRSKDFVFPPAR